MPGGHATLGAAPQEAGAKPLPPVGGRVAVEAAILDRERTGTWRLPQFATHGDARLFHKLRSVRALMSELSPSERACALGPDAAEARLSPMEQRATVLMLLEHKAGPQGEATAKALRSGGPSAS